MCNYLVIFLSLTISLNFTNCANTTNEESVIIGRDDSFCFSFTWLGTDYGNDTRMENTTCGEFLEVNKAKGVPCRHPLVITYDSSPPDVEYMWKKYRTSVACKQTKGHVCAKYSYYFNEAVQNITYMCTKVFAVGEGAITSGCYKQMKDGFEVEMCLCDSLAGDVMPCNSTNSLYSCLFLFVVFLLLI